MAKTHMKTHTQTATSLLCPTFQKWEFVLVQIIFFVLMLALVTNGKCFFCVLIGCEAAQ